MSIIVVMVVPTTFTCSPMPYKELGREKILIGPLERSF